MLDIGSGKLVFASGRRSEKGVYTVSRFSTAAYDGFYKGHWMSEDKLGDDVRGVVLSAGGDAPRVLYVGVPCDFLEYRNNFVRHVLPSARTVTSGLIDEIYARGNLFGSDKDRTVIASAACGFTLDGGYVVDPIGKQTSSVECTVTYILCDREFCSRIEKIARSAGADKICFVSAFWAESVRLIDEDDRKRGALVLDIGFSTSSAAYVKGDGFEAHSSLAVGGAHIPGDLSQVLGISYGEAERLCGQINLGFADDETYMLDTARGVVSFGADKANGIVKARLDDLAGLVRSVCPESADKLFVTGGGLLAVKGAVGYLGNSLGLNAEMFAPGVPMYSKPQYSSVFGTFDAADKIERSNTVLSRLLDKIRR